MKAKKITLKNGLRIVTVPMSGTETATVLLMVGVGSRYENEKEAGVAHFIEHMLFKGTKKRPNAFAISQELDSIGGEFNAFTSKEKTGYHVKTDAKHVEKALDVLCDIFINSKIEEKELGRERGSIIQELEMYADRPSQKVWDVFYELMYGKNPLGRDIIGYRKTLNVFKRKDLVAFMKKYYVANETVICVAGKFSQRKVVTQIEKALGALPSGPVAEYAKVIEKQKTPAISVLHKKTEQTSVIMGHRAFDHNHPDRHALALLSVILGGNMSSRLFMEIREKRGLAYSVYTNADLHRDCGYLVVKMGVAHRNLPLATELVQKEFAKLKKSLVSAKELAAAKEYLKGRTIMEMEASDEVAQFFGEQELMKNEMLPLKDFFAKLEKVTAEDIRKVANDILQKETFNIAIVGPHKKESIQKMLGL